GLVFQLLSGLGRRDELLVGGDPRGDWRKKIIAGIDITLTNPHGSDSLWGWDGNRMLRNNVVIARSARCGDPRHRAQSLQEHAPAASQPRSSQDDRLAPRSLMAGACNRTLSQRPSIVAETSPPLHVSGSPTP